MTSCTWGKPPSDPLHKQGTGSWSGWAPGRTTKLFECTGADRGRPREANWTHHLCAQLKVFTQGPLSIFNVVSANISYLHHMYVLGAIGQSMRSVDRPALLKDLLGAQQSVDRATISRSRNNQSIAQWTSLCNWSIKVQVFFCEISRSCRKSFAASTDCTGKVLRDRLIVHEWVWAIDRSCRNGLAHSTNRAGMCLWTGLNTVFKPRWHPTAPCESSGFYSG